MTDHKKHKPQPPVDAGVLLYRDKATAPRDNKVTEGAVNFATITESAKESVRLYEQAHEPPEAA